MEKKFKKPNVIIEGTGSFYNHGNFSMCGERGEEIRDNVKLFNSGKIISNDLSISGSAEVNNQGLIHSNKIKIGVKNIETFASQHPWWFASVFAIIGWLLNFIV